MGSNLPTMSESIWLEMKELTGLIKPSGSPAAPPYTLYVTLEAESRPSWSFQNGASKFDWLILTSDVGNRSCAVPRRRGGVPTVSMPFVQTCRKEENPLLDPKHFACSIGMWSWLIAQADVLPLRTAQL